MRLYRLAVLAIILCWSVAASAVTLPLKERHNGLYGLTIEAAKAKGASSRRAANILSLVVADNNVDLKDLWSLPNGKPYTVKDRYLRPGFRPSRLTIQQSKMIFDLEAATATKETEGPSAAALEAQKAELKAMEQRAIFAEKKLADLREQNKTRETEIALQLKEKNDEIARLGRELETVKAAKRSSAFAEFIKGTREFFQARPFLVALERYALVFLILLALAIFLGLVFSRLIKRNFHVMLSRSGRLLTKDGEVLYETEVSRVCLRCQDDGEDCVIPLKNWDSHLQEIHGKSRLRPVNDPDLVVGPEAHLR